MRISDWSSDVCSSDLATTTALYLAVTAAAAARVAAAVLPEAFIALLWSSGLLWTLAFALFVLRYGPLYLASGRSSEERRVGNVCVRTCRSLRSPYPLKITHN